MSSYVSKVSIYSECYKIYKNHVNQQKNEQKKTCPKNPKIILFWKVTCTNIGLSLTSFTPSHLFVQVYFLDFSFCFSHLRKDFSLCDLCANIFCYSISILWCPKIRSVNRLHSLPYTLFSLVYFFSCFFSSHIKVSFVAYYILYAIRIFSQIKLLCTCICFHPQKKYCRYCTMAVQLCFSLSIFCSFPTLWLYRYEHEYTPTNTNSMYIKSAVCK